VAAKRYLRNAIKFHNDEVMGSDVMRAHAYKLTQNSPILSFIWEHTMIKEFKILQALWWMVLNYLHHNNKSNMTN
jgi:hypothetical protein